MSDTTATSREEKRPDSSSTGQTTPAPAKHLPLWVHEEEMDAAESARRAPIAQGPRQPPKKRKP